MVLLASPLSAASQNAPQWIYVTRRFRALQSNLSLTTDELDDGATKVRGVISSLNRSFRDESSADHFFYAGSWGKNTAIRPPNDIDVFYIPPTDVFHQFNQRIGNKQSQLLQRVREALSVSYPQTGLRGDGQVVVIGFNSLTVEVVPAFPAQGGGFLICDTNDSGSWKHVWPASEVEALDASDDTYRGNTRKLTRILKQWKRVCNVPINSFHIEQLVKKALPPISYAPNDEFWFDWLVRDMFQYMIGRAGGGFFMPGYSNEWIHLGDNWQSKAESAYQRALKACDYERRNMNIHAGEEWQKIFGTAIPLQVI